MWVARLDNTFKRRAGIQLNCNDIIIVAEGEIMVTGRVERSEATGPSGAAAGEGSVKRKGSKRVAVGRPHAESKPRWCCSGGGGGKVGGELVDHGSGKVRKRGCRRSRALGGESILVKREG